LGDKGAALFFNFFSRLLGIVGVTYTEELTSQLINNVESLVFILDENGRIVVFNPACERLSGYKQQEVLGKRYEMFLPTEEVERVAQGINTVFSDKRIWQDEIQWFTKEGKRRWIACSKSCFIEKNGFAKYLLATGLDVTEARLWEKRQPLSLESDQRSKSESILVALLEKSREGFFVTSPEGSISYYSKAMEQISGYSKDQVAEHGWFYLLFPHEEERRQAVQKVRLVMAGKLEFVELDITRKDGIKNWVRFSVTPLEIDGKQHTLTTLGETAKSEPLMTENLPILN